jgi:hypothetical protein
MTASLGLSHAPQLVRAGTACAMNAAFARDASRYRQQPLQGGHSAPPRGERF